MYKGYRNCLPFSPNWERSLSDEFMILEVCAWKIETLYPLINIKIPDSDTMRSEILFMIYISDVITYHPRSSPNRANNKKFVNRTGCGYIEVKASCQKKTYYGTFMFKR